MTQASGEQECGRRDRGYCRERGDYRCVPGQHNSARVPAREDEDILCRGECCHNDNAEQGVTVQPEHVSAEQIRDSRLDECLERGRKCDISARTDSALQGTLAVQ